MQTWQTARRRAHGSGAPPRPAPSGGRRTDRAGADHGRAASRPSGAGARRRSGAPAASWCRSSSIPTQFAPNEDFASYPRGFDSRRRGACAAKVDLVWAPSAEVMYPEGFATRIVPEGAAKAGLEDKFRPHFFGGVATVVAKLFTQTAPDFALFGEKDYQQLRVVTQMAKDLDLPVKVVGVPTVREKDGLALSSRNAYLSASRARGRAGALSRAQGQRRAHQTRRADRTGARRRPRRDRARRLCARLSRSAPRADAGAGRLAQGRADPARLVGARKIGKTRLIDQCARA